MSLRRARSDVRRILEGIRTELAPGRTVPRRLQRLAGLPEHGSVRHAVGRFRDRWEIGSAEDEPVFIFASGWRSGSTLLQRLVMGSGEVFVWGEPYARMDLVRRLADSWLAVTDQWPRDRDLLLDGHPPLSATTDWLANIAPPPRALVDAHRAFFRTLWDVPKDEHGADVRPGLKEVRLSADYAHYFKALFPRARFLFLIRDPYEQWRSYRKWASWFDRWPAGQVTAPAHFGRIWRHLVSSFLDPAPQLDALVVRYEELLRSSQIRDQISSHLHIEVPTGILDQRVTGTSRANVDVPADEARQLRRAVDPVARDLGYLGR